MVYQSTKEASSPADTFAKILILRWIIFLSFTVLLFQAVYMQSFAWLQNSPLLRLFNASRIYADELFVYLVSLCETNNSCFWVNTANTSNLDNQSFTPRP